MYQNNKSEQKIQHDKIHFYILCGYIKIVVLILTGTTVTAHFR